MSYSVLKKILSIFLLSSLLFTIPVFADAQSDLEEVYTSELVEALYIAPTDVPGIDSVETLDVDPAAIPGIDSANALDTDSATVPGFDPTVVPDTDPAEDQAYAEAYDLRMDYMQDLIYQDANDIRAEVYEEMSSTVTAENFWEKFSQVPEINQMDLCALGMETYGVDFRWMGMLIGTTARENYIYDPYLYYAWACAMLNDYRWYPADAVYWLMSGWGGVTCEACGAYYSEHAVVYGCNYHASFCNVSQEVLKCIYLALVDRDERIFEVDGMITGGNYSRLIYNSPVYNCQVWSW